MNKLCDRFENEIARIESLIVLASVLAHESTPDNFQEFVEDTDDKEMAQLFPTVPEEVLEELSHDLIPFQEWLINENKYGFLVKFATPVMKDHAFSWGHYAVQWVYGETFDEALEKGFAWVAERRKEGH